MDSAEDTLAGGLPHSEIPGSTIARISPGLFAACHALHRLSVPRHPPDALLFTRFTQHYPPLTGTSPSGTTLKWQRSREDTLYLSRQRTAQGSKLLALS